MSSKLKRDQIPPQKAENWKQNFKEEESNTFSLAITPIILQKATYKSLIGENENRVRVYLGLDDKNENGKYVLCAFAVSSFLLGSGDVYADYETPVYKLSKENEDFSNRTEAVIESIHLYRKWRAGEIEENEEGAVYRKFIYPNAYLLTKYELHELFNAQNHEKINIKFGIQKTMDIMLCADSGKLQKSADDDCAKELEIFNNTGLCPPYCDERSIYNS
ncbi:MAG TPA: hypothetical protein VEP89_03950 [Draconibacterium sp.]|nr:hypothetical protein [Draconibacterium sp.]